MSQLIMLLPAAFPALALAHFVALLSPGPDFFLIVGHAARRRLKGTIWICAGIAFGNAVYIGLAIAGWSGLRQSPVLFRCVEVAGAFWVAWLGIMLLRSARRGFSASFREQAALSPARQLLTGLASALLNPKNAVFYLALMTGILGPGVTMGQQAFAGIWMFAVVFVWDILLAASLSHPKSQQKLQRHIPHLEALAGLVLVFLGLAIAFVSVSGVVGL